MEKETFSGMIESAYGETLNPALPFSGSYDKFTSYDEIVEAGELPKSSEIVTFVNARRKAAAVQAERNKVLSENNINKPTLETSTDLRVKVIADALLAQDKTMTREQAEQVARKTLGL